jgi:hypothetical protein
MNNRAYSAAPLQSGDILGLSTTGELFLKQQGVSTSHRCDDLSRLAVASLSKIDCLFMAISEAYYGKHRLVFPIMTSLPIEVPA